MKKKLAAAALLVLLLLPPTVAQNPTPSAERQDKPGQEDVVTITSNLVQIDVVVTDKDGKQVTDLRADDFEIAEDSKRQQITNFTYVSAESPQVTPAAGEVAAARNAATPPPARLRRDQVRRTIALVVDDLGL